MSHKRLDLRRLILEAKKEPLMYMVGNWDPKLGT